MLVNWFAAILVLESVRLTYQRIYHLVRKRTYIATYYFLGIPARPSLDAPQEKIDIEKAAKELGLHDSQLYGWRSKARAKQDQSDLEQSLAAEHARLKHKLADQAEELAIVYKATYFAKS